MLAKSENKFVDWKVLHIRLSVTERETFKLWGNHDFCLALLQGFGLGILKVGKIKFQQQMDKNSKDKL